MQHTDAEMTDTEKLEYYSRNVGSKVRKTSGKPFKSRLKVNTVTGIVTHPTQDVPAYTFAEDASCVECWRCITVSNLVV